MNVKRLAGGVLLGMIVLAGAGLNAEELTGESLARVAPHMVRVLYHLQYHHGEEPEAPGWMERCTGCGRYHINRAASAAREERPAELPGILLSANFVLLPDPMVHPQFVEKITVLRRSDVRSARVSGYAVDRVGIMLELDEPMPDTPELSFDGSRDEPYFAVTYREVNGRWLLRGSVLDTRPAIDDAGQVLVTVPAPSLIVDSSGAAVTATMQTELPAAVWKDEPANWEWLSREHARERLDVISEIVDSTVVRVRMDLRSPPSREESMMRFRGGMDEHPTEIHAPGVVLHDGRLLILAELTPRTTARLERIRAFLPGEDSIEAEFLASLQDYGALIARLDEIPVGAGVEITAMSEAELQGLRNQWLPSATVRISGNRRICRMDHIRIGDMTRGWREQLIPELRNRGNNLFAFEREGRLLLLPVTRRDRAAGAERYYRTNNPLVTATTYLAPILADTASYTDVANVPLSEEAQGRLAWLGLELQELTEEMAEMAGVTDEFDRFRRSGALVAYVYPGSPAEEAGMEIGMVLMRLRLPGQMQPIRVEAQDDHFFGRSFPWEELDQVPVEYLENIPRPWPTAACSFNEMLTDIGIGQRVIADIVHDGERMERIFVIEEGPPHYDIAPRHVSEELGMTVRDLTYELRRYFRRPEGEPGVIISRVAPGGRAAISGLKPYEIITHVDDVEVSSVDEWRDAVEGRRELKLSVRRMARGRVARIILPDGE